jgi:ABC-type uncharacterized transport system substrate-binding protein
MSCINHNHPEFEFLLNESGLSKLELELTIDEFQSKNNTDEFPSIEDLNKSSTKVGVEELFDENPELANQVYSKILTNSGISGENLLSLLLKDNIIEKQCS